VQTFLEEILDAKVDSLENMMPTDSDMKIRFFPMRILDFSDRTFAVAKLRRVTSAPVQEGTVAISREGLLGRLSDIFRLGTKSRNFADLCKIERLLQEQFHTDAMTEWANYEKVICRALGVERLEPLGPKALLPVGGKRDLPVTLHLAEMNDLPYLVAGVNHIMGSPAPIFMTWPNEKESALERLRDVFRIGVQGCVFKDFAQIGLKVGRSQEEILTEWQASERAAMS
jgi:hypothetical protein